MGNLSMFENIIDKKLNAVHTAFLGRVTSFNGSSATIQVLKQGGTILPNVPVIHSARKREDETPLQNGDVVICLCSEDSISTAKKGKIPSANEPSEKHSLSNSIVIGIL